MRDLREPLDQLTERVMARAGWWAEPSGDTDGLFVVRCESGVIAEHLTQRQAMTIASEYNLARTDAQALARHKRTPRTGSDKKTA